MNHLFVTLFINDRVCRYKVDELIQNSLNGYVSESLVFKNHNIYLPIQIQGDGYYLQSKSPDWTCRCDSREITSKCLQHGDYLIFSRGNVSYAALITDYASIGLSCRAYALPAGNVFFGRSEEMHILLDLNTNISRKCAAIRADGTGAHYLEDLSGKTGIYVNDRRINSHRLEAGDRIFIMGTTVVYFPTMLVLPAAVKVQGLAPVEAFDVMAPAEREDAQPYVRTPRIIKSKEEGKIVIDPPPAPHKSKELPFILTAGPSMTMSLAMLASLGVTISNALKGGGFSSLITSGVMAVSMLLGALFWPTLLRRYNKRQEEANEAYRRKKYSAYLAEKEEEIRRKYDRSVRVLNENLMPDPGMLAQFLREKSRRLWERVPGDEDFLMVRLGLGELDFDVEIQAPAKGFTLEEDPMIDEAVALKERYAKLRGVPIPLSLRDKRVVGVVGDTASVAEVIITNLIALHSSDEVKLVLVYNVAEGRSIAWANDLPHVWSGDRAHRYVATNREEAKTLFASLDEEIQSREAVLSKGDPRIPAYVVLVMDETLVEDIPFRRYLINPNNTVGVSTVFFGRRFNHIPKECVAIIQKDEDICGIYVKNENNNRFITYTSDSAAGLAEEIAAGINRIPVKQEKGKASVPDRVTFLDMYRVGNVDALEITNHWGTNSSDKSLAAPIGLKAGGEIFSLDIHEKYHGCHGLVAGTTGSGKSEFLQAYILSMMVNYSPNEVAFVLVDFKGGDMARPFLKSPHLAATISNLSGNTLRRALVSLEAEVKSRQNLFNRSAEQLGVDKIDINSYHKHFKDKKLKQPLPHLIIVIDEFAQLKSQHPEFMAKLVDIAQVGRSLGIHLILATQRPSGVVDPQIWSNSKFKVCLKVLDKQDSMDMINHPEAALIKQPGRAYVQVGYDEIFEQIQSGYSGADYVAQAAYVDEESVSVNLVNWPAEKIRTAKRQTAEQKGGRTQLEETVAIIAANGESMGLRVRQLWLPPLPTEIRLEDCTGDDFVFSPDRWDTADYGEIICGTVDLPERQEQRPYAVDFLQRGHLAIYGSSGVGKSTLVQTLVFSLTMRYSPEMFHLFVLDFDGSSLAGLTAMPHCAGYAAEGDDAGVENLLRTLQEIINTRRELFARHHCANYTSYLSGTGEKLPMILLVLDNYAAFREKMYRSEDMLVQLVSAARSCGIFLVVTGNSKGAIYYKITEQIAEKIVLNMNDSGAYRDILNLPTPILPEQNRGRALAVVEGRSAELQLAVPFDVANESARMGRIRQIYGEMAACTEQVSYGFAPGKAEEPAPVSAEVTAMHISEMENPDPVTDTPETLILGCAVRSGELYGFPLTAGSRVFVSTGGDDTIAPAVINRLAEKFGGRICLVTSGDTCSYVDAVEPVEDLDAYVAELTDAMAVGVPVPLTVISGFADFYDRISDEALEQFERLLAGENAPVVVTFDGMDRLIDYRDTGLYVRLVRTPRGMIVRGGIDDTLAAAITDEIYAIPCRYREKALPSGQAILYDGAKMTYIAVEGGENRG
ncbi:MAG: type VII secretion protein EssC [Ruminococcaceae bacterium]|nr:type VII secretion protein EssC [Oscillospiraceae bacterium]